LAKFDFQILILAAFFGVNSAQSTGLLVLRFMKL